MPIHPLSQFMRESIKIFTDLGFEIATGPEIETEKYNFDLLNVPKNHPARDVQDTFFLENKKILRTHTSAVQIRAMENKKPPVRIVVPGRCFRNEATDATHETTFYHLECFAIDKDITLGNLFWILEHYFKKIYGTGIKIRKRPHFYPFVEPGMDIDIKIKDKWIEMLGSGMIHPQVLRNMKVDPSFYSGFAFALGIDRLAMLYFGIPDIRFYYQNDFRFLKQFDKKNSQ